MTIGRYSKRKSIALSSRSSAKQRDGYSRKSITSTGTEDMSMGPTSKAIEEMKALDPEGKVRFGYKHFKKLMENRD
jgi:hypothetical protein